MKKNFLIGALALTLSLWADDGDMLKVYQLSDREQAELVMQYTKIKFRNDSIFIFDETNAIVFANSLAKVRVIIFDENENPEPIIATETEDVEVSNSLYIYPNPATYEIQVKGTMPISYIEVLSANGNRMPTKVSLNGNNATVDVSALPNGTYLMMVNQNAVKFIKQ